ncbi:MAG TPA: ABC transporter permease subunit [Aggregatilineales bacterium]|nr:ABC transporter permease subunit [Aggregatilineales bacterium]
MATAEQTVQQTAGRVRKRFAGLKPLEIVARDWRRNKYLYLMLLPVILYYFIFQYVPIYGSVIAFQDFNPAKGISGSTWIGFQNFTNFFQSFYFGRLIQNTLVISLLDLVLGFPAPIILALLLNELRWGPFRRLVQTITYMPHFISIVVLVGMMVDFTAKDGLFNTLISQTVGGQPILFMQKPELFPFLYVLSGVWQNIGWGSIIYLAAITTIDPTLYEAAMVDGANRFQQIRHITLPGITPTIIILLILRLGSTMAVGFEKILLMYNPLTMQTADVISTYVYRKGVLEADYGFSAAVGLFNSVINFTLLTLSNRFSRRMGDTSLW